MTCLPGPEKSSLSRPAMIATAVMRLFGKDRTKASRWLEAGLLEFPGHPALLLVQRQIRAAGVPAWHVPMMLDADRNLAYEQAIHAVVKPGMRVLEIGTGSGLLAMMACRAGAAHVVTCEADPRLAETARRIIAENNLSDRITVISGHSTSLDADRIGGRADVLVTEIFGATLVQEGALRSIAHAKQALLTSDAPIIPASGTINVALVDYEATHRERLANVHGFDLRHFLTHISPMTMVKADDPRVHLRSSAVSICHHDFTRAVRTGPRESSIELTSAGGQVTAVAAWQSFSLAPSVSYESFGVRADGSRTQSHWGLSLYALPAPLFTRSGDIVPVTAVEDIDVFMLWPAPA